MARIGPNAVTRLAEAVTDRLGHETCERLFAAAGLSHHLTEPPGQMVAEVDVVALYRSLAACHPAEAEAIGADAGRRTAIYLLGNRIPSPVQAVLRLLPPALAARLLLSAIGRHAWTFAGSGAFSTTQSGGVTVIVAGGPFAAAGPAEDALRAFYEAVFGHLFATLVSRRCRVTNGMVDGGTCQFHLTWTARRARLDAGKTGALQQDMAR